MIRSLSCIINFLVFEIKMWIFIVIIWFLLIILWIVWSFLPILPWPFLGYMALILLKIYDKNIIETKTLIIWGIVIIVITVLDYILPILWTKKMWWTKYWTKWATIWLIFSFVILPILWITIWPFWLFWIILCPFLWAFVGETLNSKNKRPFKSALWSFLWFLSWTLLKLFVCIFIAVPFIKHSYDLIKLYF